MAADAGAIEEPGASRGADFLGRPKDWIEKLGRSFFPSEHTHLQHGAAGGEHSAPPAQPDVREMLPWLRLTVALDPHKTEVYTVAAYWLRSQMGKVDEAEEFLLEGLRNNSNSYPILFELGRIAAENRQDSGRARNLWEEALSQWKLQNAAAEEPDNFRLSQICLRLAILERDSGNFSAAEAYLKMVQAVSPNPAEVQKRIDELRLEAEKPR
jgi:tetratricopeptide (TPR) repeat protein